MTRDAALTASFLLSAAAMGCSSEPSRYAVDGVVTMDGAPAPMVVVRFYPVDPNSTFGASGATDPAGKFTIGEEGKNTGLPAGEYNVTFSQTLINGKPTLGGSGGKAAEKAPTEKEAVADDYRDPQKTPVTVTVKGGANNFPFEIKANK